MQEFKEFSYPEFADIYMMQHVGIVIVKDIFQSKWLYLVEMQKNTIADDKNSRIPLTKKKSVYELIGFKRSNQTSIKAEWMV